MTAVTVNPVKKPEIGEFINGLSVSKSMVFAISVIALTADIITAKPKIAVPVPLFLKYSAKPIIADIGTAYLPPPETENATSHEVAQVPILAPIINPTAESNEIVPAETNATVRTVTAEDDCKTAVNITPTSNDRNMFCSRRITVLFNLPSMQERKPEVISAMPKIKSAADPKKSIIILLSLLNCAIDTAASVM